MEQVIPEELQQVAVSGLRPCWVLLEPDPGNTWLQLRDGKTLHSGDSWEGILTRAAR